MGPQRGFYQHNYMHHGGHDYVQRTYFYGGHSHACAYRSYYWGGRPYEIYARPYFYRPAFYGWAYTPWVAPVYYDWDWRPAPWYGYYGAYFAPEPIYPTPALWIADFILAANLQAAYEVRQTYATYPAQPQDSGYDDEPQAYSGDGAAVATDDRTVRLSPEVKRAIATEVEAQLQAEKNASLRNADVESQADSDDAPPPALDPSTSVFIVSDSLTVSDLDGQECELTAGDVLSRLDDTPGEDGSVQVRVTASKRGDCPTGSKPLVQVGDLQEMNNRFREQLDAGLTKLAAGGKGLPAAPDTETVAGEVPPPQPDDVADQVQQLQVTADQTEQAVGR